MNDNPIKSRPATPEYRSGWERIFGVRPIVDCGPEYVVSDRIEWGHDDSGAIATGVVTGVDSSSGSVTIKSDPPIMVLDYEQSSPARTCGDCAHYDGSDGKLFAGRCMFPASSVDGSVVSGFIVSFSYPANCCSKWRRR